MANGSFYVKSGPADALENLLGKFFKEVRKQNGGEYEPDNLSSLKKHSTSPEIVKAALQYP